MLYGAEAATRDAGEQDGLQFDDAPDGAAADHVQGDDAPDSPVVLAYDLVWNRCTITTTNAAASTEDAQFFVSFNKSD